MTATKVRNVRLTDEQWNALLDRALENGFKNRAEYVVELSKGPLVVQVEKEVIRTIEKIVEVNKPRLSFEEAWEKLGKPKRDKLTGYPGSENCAKALYEME